MGAIPQRSHPTAFHRTAHPPEAGTSCDPGDQPVLPTPAYADAAWTAHHRDRRFVRFPFELRLSGKVRGYVAEPPQIGYTVWPKHAAWRPRHSTRRGGQSWS